MNDGQSPKERYDELEARVVAMIARGKTYSNWSEIEFDAWRFRKTAGK